MLWSSFNNPRQEQQKMNVTFNLMGGGELNIPSRAISGFYKDEFTSEVIVEVNGDEYKVRDSLDEVRYILGLAR